MPGKRAPENLKEKLPKHAQHIYAEAYNNAYEQYDTPGERRGGESREAAANKVAWAAIKKKYKKAPTENGIKNKRHKRLPL